MVAASSVVGYLVVDVIDITYVSVFFVTDYHRNCNLFVGNPIAFFRPKTQHGGCFFMCCYFTTPFSIIVCQDCPFVMHVTCSTVFVFPWQFARFVFAPAIAISVHREPFHECPVTIYTQSIKKNIHRHWQRPRIVPPLAITIRCFCSSTIKSYTSLSSVSKRYLQPL